MSAYCLDGIKTAFRMVDDGVSCDCGYVLAQADQVALRFHFAYCDKSRDGWRWKHDKTCGCYGCYYSTRPCLCPGCIRRRVEDATCELEWRGMRPEWYATGSIYMLVPK